MRIALIGEGTRGDIAPLCHLASRLVALGHSVRLVTRPDFADASPAGVEFRAVGPPIQDFTTRHAGAFRGMGLSFARASARYREECFSVQFRELPGALAGCEMAFGAGMVLGAPSVAEKLGLPYRLILYCPALLPSPENAPAFVPHAGPTPWVNRALWALILGPFDRWLRGALNRERGRLGLPALRKVMPHLLGERPILCADPELAPLPLQWTGRADAARYFAPEPALPTLPEKIEAFLQSGDAPVFVGFGSMPDADPKTTTRLLLEAVEKAGCRALLSAGWAGLGEAALPASVSVVDEVPHGLLFPRVAGVVHHGGAGTTTTAARAGVPQLVVPHVLDQYYWAHRVHGLGLGPPPLRRARLSAEGLAAGIRGMIEAEWLADSAAGFGEGLRAALEPDREDLETLLAPKGQLRDKTVKD